MDVFTYLEVAYTLVAIHQFSYRRDVVGADALSVTSTEHVCPSEGEP